MVAIQNFLSSIGNAITLAWEFICSMFSDFFQLLQLIVKMPLYVYNLFSWIPPELLAVLYVTISIVILYKILGREG